MLIVRSYGEPTVTGILVLLFNSSGSRVRNCRSVGTAAGFLPNVSIMVWTALSHAGSCNARPEIARHNWVRIDLGPASYRLRAVMSVSRRAIRWA